MRKADFLLMWSHKRPKSFFAASLQSLSKDLYCIQFAALIRPSHIYALFNGCVSYADHKNQAFLGIFFTNCAFKWPVVLAWSVVTLLIYKCITSYPFTSSLL